MTDFNNIAGVLERAAELIEPEGAWTQGCYARAGLIPTDVMDARADCFCGLGAILWAAKLPSAPRAARHPAVCFMADEWGGDIGRFVTFNDADGRSQAEVVAKLREAAAKAREQGQ